MSHPGTTERRSAGARQPIDAIVLDYGEVLCLPADRDAMARMAVSAGLTPDAFREIYWRFREDYDRGVFDGPAYWRQVSAASQRSWTDAEVAALIAQDVAVWTMLDERMLAWTATLLDRGVKVGLLSNMVAEIGRHLRTNLGLLSRFAAVTYSCEVGSIKPEPRVYHHVLDGLGVAADRALLIDDRQVNIDGARAIGMHGIRFQGYDALMRDLAAGYVIGGRPST